MRPGGLNRAEQVSDQWIMRLRRRDGNPMDYQGVSRLSILIFVKINGKRLYLWRAVDQDGEVVDAYLKARRDGAAAKRFFKWLIRCNGGEPRKIVTDKLRSYSVAHRELMPDIIHSTAQYANHRAEQSHEPTRVRERGMRRFKSSNQAQRFISVHAAVYNQLTLGRLLVEAEHYRYIRISVFNDWEVAVA